MSFTLGGVASKEEQNAGLGGGCLERLDGTQYARASPREWNGIGTLFWTKMYLDATRSPD